MTHYFSVPLATCLTLLAASMWGSWMQVVKLKEDYPIAGISFMLYMFSFVLVWGITLILSPLLLSEGIFAAIAQHKTVIWEIMLGGAMMSIGLLISLTLMSDLGLMLATTLSGAITSILGLVTSIYKEGVPQDPKGLPLIIVTTVIFLLAGYICSKASQMCETDRAIIEGKEISKRPKSKITIKVITLIIIDSLLINGWAIGTASGTASGMPPILTCAFMATGSAISILITGLILFTKKRQWRIVLCIGSSKKPLALSAISALCHYGGNILSIYAMPAISATLSFLFGKTANIWTYFWGFYYKEFTGARTKTMVTLFGGLILYFAGLGLLFFYNFGR